MKEKDIYPPKRTGIKHLLCQLVWASESGVNLESVTVDKEVMISHPKSNWDFCLNLDSAKDRLDAELVILNWVNKIYPATFDECDWP